MKSYFNLFLLLSLLACEGPTPNLSIVGYTDKQSYYNTEIQKIYTNSTNSILKLFDVDEKIVASEPITYTNHIIIQNKPSINGYNYQVSFDHYLNNISPGIYFWANKIPFIIKSKAPLPITVVYPSNTVNAYSNSGGKSLYSSNSSNNKAAHKVSFLRPLPINEEISGLPFFKWIKNLKYEVNYIADIDMDSIQLFAKSKILIIVGHSEYWTRKARLNFDKFVNNGGDAIILSGNTMWWQVRYNDNALICYKDSLLDSIDNHLLKTVPWNTKSLQYPILFSIGSDYEHGGYGDRADKGWDGFKIVNENSPLLKGTNLKNGDIIKLHTHEYDGALLIETNNLNTIKVDNEYYKFYKNELIGYDIGYRLVNTFGTFIVFQKSKTSGSIINVGSTNWCAKNGIGDFSNNNIRIITRNAIELLLHNKNIFTN